MLERIDKRAFLKCVKLEKVTSPVLAEIKFEAFENCSELIEINISHVKNLHAGAFYCCSNLRLPSVLPELEEIHHDAFYSCVKISELSAPNLKIIGASAFNKCRNLKCIDIPSVKAIGECAFRDCDSLEVVKAPLAESIGYGVFQWCSKLSCENIMIPDDINKKPLVEIDWDYF